MPAFICRTCGVQYPPSPQPPAACPICQDERQYVGWNGQQWTTLDDLAREGRRNEIRELEPGLAHVATVPPLAIGQRALLVQTGQGNVLWDCVSYLDDATVQALDALGGVQAIAVSHPHFYATMCTWSSRFGDCPVYVHAADRQWVPYATEAVKLWEGTSLEILPGVTLLNTGGHFDGSAALHWAGGAAGKGLLLTGDSLTVVMDRRYVSFMYSYPNLIPLPAAAVRRIVDVVRPYRFERIYGAWDGRVVAADGPDAVERSAERYIRYLEGRGPA